MGSITIQVIGDVSVGTKSKTYNYSDADINRLVAYGRALFGAGATITQGLVAWSDQTIKQMQQQVVSDERSIAAAVASNVITIITTT